jgi:hypothetical protein
MSATDTRQTRKETQCDQYRVGQEVHVCGGVSRNIQLRALLFSGSEQFSTVGEEERTPFEVRESSREWRNPSQVTLIILISYLHSCVAYVLYGMNLERTQKMNDLFSDTLTSLFP